VKITVVVPLFNERETLETLAEGISEHVALHDHRILFVDDGSTDGSFEVLCGLQERYDTVDVIRFRRNLGKSAALAAGFAEATGDVVVTMDADLQDDPKEIPRLLEALEDGCDVVCGWKQVRHDPWHKTAASRVYNGVVAWVFGLALHDVNCGFKALRTDVVKNIHVYGERHRLIPVLAADLGYRLGEVPVEHRPRLFGKSKYGFERFTRGAMDVLSVWFLRRYRHAPGHFFGNVGWAALGLGAVGLAAAAVGWRCLGARLTLLGTGLVCAGLFALALGLVAELIVAQRPPVDLDAFIAEKRCGPARDA